MRIKLENPSTLSKAIEIISDIVTEVRIKVSDFGMSINAIDPANVTMVSFKMPRSIFSEFESGKEVLGVNLENLKRILRRCGAGSTLIMEKKENQLNLQIQDKIKRDFNMSLIDIESEDKEMPNLEFSSQVELSSVDLVSVVEDCAVVDDACSFIIKEGKFIIEAKNINSARIEFSADEAIIDAEDCKARYSLEYLQKFMKAAKLCEKTLIRFANDHPMKMDFRTKELELSFILAPRVETDD
jgi:proliferating cell nuclear antigen